MSKERFNLTGKNIVITGASSGIGKQCAIDCSNMGANVILISRDKTKLELTRSEMAGDAHLVLPYDLTNFDDVDDTFEKAIKKFGVIHGFIHSAGIQITSSINLININQYRKLFDLNVCSALNITRIISKKMFVPEEGSSIIYISSILGLVAKQGLSGYSATKGALISASRSLAVELAKKKIRVNCVSPGLIMTPMMEKQFNSLPDTQKAERVKGYPLGLGNTTDVSNACIFLISDASRWITGTNLIVDGGFTTQ